MTNERETARELLDREARQYGWTVSPEFNDGSVVYERGETNVIIVWTGPETARYASIGTLGSVRRVPASPRMALVNARAWFSAPGE